MVRHISPHMYSPELDETDSFVVVILRSREGGALFGDEGGRVGSSRDASRMWVLVQDAAGGVAMLENTRGRFLCAEPDGKVRSYYHDTSIMYWRWFLSSDASCLLPP